MISGRNKHFNGRGALQFTIAIIRAPTTLSRYLIKTCFENIARRIQILQYKVRTAYFFSEGVNGQPLNFSSNSTKRVHIWSNQCNFGTPNLAYNCRMALVKKGWMYVRERLPTIVEIFAKLLKGIRIIVNRCWRAAVVVYDGCNTLHYYTLFNGESTASRCS